MTIVETMLPGGVFNQYFGKDLSSWAGWIAVLKSIYGLPLDETELEFWRTYTNRQTPSKNGYEDVIVAAGRRSGKTLISALLACYECLFGGFDEQLKPGEHAFGMLLASTKKQANEGLHYCKALIRSFEKSVGTEVIVNEKAEELELYNGLILSVMPVVNASIRGRAVAFAACDEVAFWKDADAANPASDILTALYPSKMPGARLIQISSAWSKWGWFWDMFQQHYGVEDDEVLFVKAPTRVLNPSHRASIVRKMGNLFKGRNEDSNLEFEGEFRDVTEGFLPYDLIVQHMTRPAVTGPDGRHRYVAFIDSAGGARSTGDSYTLAVAHREADGRVVVDMVQETHPPFDVVEITKKYAEMVRRFGCWTAAWREHGRMKVEKSPLSASELYLDIQQRLQSGLVELCEDETLKLQLQQLRVFREQGGRTRVDHVAYGSAHDDLSNAVAGAVFVAANTNLILSAVEEAAKLPVVGHHQADRFLSPPMKEARRQEEVRRSAEQEMDDFMKQGGHATRVGQGVPRRWWER
jgi:hypothetical protein